MLAARSRVPSRRVRLRSRDARCHDRRRHPDRPAAAIASDPRRIRATGGDIVEAATTTSATPCATSWRRECSLSRRRRPRRRPGPSAIDDMAGTVVLRRPAIASRRPADRRDTGHMTSTSGPAIAVTVAVRHRAPGPWPASRGLPGGGACRLAGAGGRRQRPGRRRTRGARARGIGQLRRGRGSAMSEEGFIELDAGMMDGARLQVGSVTSVRGVPHAITPPGASSRVYSPCSGCRCLPVRRAHRGRNVRSERPCLGPRASAVGGTSGAPGSELGRDDVRS